MTLVTAIASQKGGVSKTTTSISLAAGLARRGHRVLLVDMDSQANSSKVLLPHYQSLRKDDTVYSAIIGRKTMPIHHTAIAQLDIAPSHILLSNADVELPIAKDHREARLKSQLDKIKGGYEFVFIDCPPALGWLTLNALTASDQVIVVISPGYFELESVNQMNMTIYEVQQDFNPSLKIRGFLFCMADVTVNSKTSLKILRQAYPEYMLHEIVPKTVDLKDASFNQQDIFAYKPHSLAATAYWRVLAEVFDEPLDEAPQAVEPVEENSHA